MALSEREFIEDVVAPAPERRYRITPLQIVRADTVVRFDRRATDHAPEENAQANTTTLSAAARPTQDYLEMRKAEFDANNAAGDEFFCDTGVILRQSGIDRGEITVYPSGNINDIVNDIRAETEIAYHMQPESKSKTRQVVDGVLSAFSINPYYLAVDTSRSTR
jgi:hypothetical protein